MAAQWVGSAFQKNVIAKSLWMAVEAALRRPKAQKPPSACSKRTSAHLDFVAYCYLSKVVEAEPLPLPGGTQHVQI